MAQDTSEVRVALTGHIFFALSGVTDPTTFSVAGALAGGFVELGFTTEDGVAFSIGKETEDLMGWQSNDPLRTLITSEPKSAKYTLRQLNQDNWRTTFGGTFTDEGGGTTLWEPTDGELVEGFYVAEFIDGADKYQIGFRHAQQAAANEFSFVRSDSVNLSHEMKALATTDGKKPWFVRTNDSTMGTVAAPANWAATTAKTLGVYVTLVASGAIMRCTTAGTTGSTAPTAPLIGNTVIDGTVVWLRTS